MLQVSRRKGRLLSLLLALVFAGDIAIAAPATTRISDVVYRADGLPAGGTLLISWPAFLTAGNEPVAAGSMSVLLGPDGTLTVDLVPNAGASPAGTLYKVVYQLTDGATETEFWTVGASSPTTLAAVRTTPGSGTAAQVVSQQYVDALLANKANDAAVVHKSGGEFIEGAKQFSAPPTVPTPLLATDAVNKAYVDGAVAAVGAGSFVSKSGDAMTGPLTLPGDPTAPDHAATRHYVDTGLAAKASLIAGLVPPSQLASGTAEATRCLKGDQTWGACDTSSNATFIQGIPVDAAAPTDGQVPTYEAASGTYKAKTGSGTGLTAGMQKVKWASDLSWSATPSNDLSTPGSKTVNLTACPAGVLGSESEYYVYISGTGTAEAVKVTGGTCAGNGSAGTLQFTTLNAHAAGYTVGSASGGIQEASIAARFVPSGSTSQSGKVIIPPGEYNAYARISIRASGQTLDFSGSIVNCYVQDSCLFLGDPAASTAFTSITVQNFRGRPMVASGVYAMIEDNAQASHILKTVVRSGDAGNTFGYLVKVDNDQAAVIDGLNTSLGTGLRCDATFCGAAVYGPGPSATNAGVLWVKNSNISLNCAGNGVLNKNGNTLHVSDTVIQGFNQYGVIGGIPNGGLQGTALTNVYMEVGSCTNPQYASPGNQAMAGLIEYTKPATVRGGPSPVGSIPRFLNNAGTQYNYYVVIRDSVYGPSAPLYAGYANSNGTDTINVQWPKVTGTNTITYDLLVATGAGYSLVSPNGTSTWAVATGVAQCAGPICSHSDTNAARASYTVPAPTYFPKLDFWPGGAVLTPSADDVYVSSVPILTADNLKFVTSLSPLISVAGKLVPTVFTSQCGLAMQGVWVSCLTADSSHNSAMGATVLQYGLANGPPTTGLKGRLNFGFGVGANSSANRGHILTLVDSNFSKTLSTGEYRPTYDAADSFLGIDTGNTALNAVGLAYGAPVSHSFYINSNPDGTSWLERLTANLKEFKTNVTVNGNLTVTGTCAGCISGGQTVNGDLTVTGKVSANSFESTGTGPWTVEGAYGAMTAAAANKSKLGFGTNGKLSVSENGGTVSEIAKKLPQEFTYTFFDANNLLTTSLQVPSIYVNRAAALHIVEVYCEIDAGSASINLQKDNGTTEANILSSDLACSTAGAVSSTFVSGNDAIAVGQKVNHVTVSASGSLHRMNVVVKYMVD